MHNFNQLIKVKFQSLINRLQLYLDKIVNKQSQSKQDELFKKWKPSKEKHWPLSSLSNPFDLSTLAATTNPAHVFIVIQHHKSIAIRKIDLSITSRSFEGFFIYLLNRYPDTVFVKPVCQWI